MSLTILVEVVRRRPHFWPRKSQIAEGWGSILEKELYVLSLCFCRHIHHWPCQTQNAGLNILIPWDCDIFSQLCLDSKFVSGGKKKKVFLHGLQLHSVEFKIQTV